MDDYETDLRLRRKLLLRCNYFACVAHRPLRFTPKRRREREINWGEDYLRGKVSLSSFAARENCLIQWEAHARDKYSKRTRWVFVLPRNKASFLSTVVPHYQMELHNRCKIWLYNCARNVSRFRNALILTRSQRGLRKVTDNSIHTRYCLSLLY